MGRDVEFARLMALPVADGSELCSATEVRNGGITNEVAGSYLDCGQQVMLLAIPVVRICGDFEPIHDTVKLIPSM